jgi:hypothetical protein
VELVERRHREFEPRRNTGICHTVMKGHSPCEKVINRPSSTQQPSAGRTDKLIYKSQQHAHVRVYFILQLLYMFRASSSPIFRSTKQLYLQHLVFVTPLLLSAAISLNRFECAVGGVRHPQHTQTGSNSSTTAADSSNGVTNNRCCRYSCFVLLKMGDDDARNM